MFKDITIGQYYKQDSYIHNLDARAKLIFTVWFIVAIFVCKNYYSLALIFLFTIVSMFVSKVPLKMFLKSLRPVLILVLFTAVLNILYTHGGTVLISFWKVTIDTKGIYTAVFMAIRIVCLIICSSLLTYTTTPTMLTDAIERLLSPLKKLHVPVHNLAMMMTLALRFIPTLIEEINRITNAQKARGADFESGNVIRRMKALVPVLIPLFVSSFSRAYDLAFAMSCRCYTGGNGRTRMKQMKLGYRDLVCTLVFAAVTAGIILLNVFYKKIL